MIQKNLNSKEYWDENGGEEEYRRLYPERNEGRYNDEHEKELEALEEDYISKMPNPEAYYEDEEAQDDDDKELDGMRDFIHKQNSQMDNLLDILKDIDKKMSKMCDQDHIDEEVNKRLQENYRAELMLQTQQGIAEFFKKQIDSNKH